MVVFKYIEDKDVFLKYYNRLYSKRLVQGSEFIFFVFKVKIYLVIGIFLGKKSLKLQ